MLKYIFWFYIKICNEEITFNCKFTIICAGVKTTEEKQSKNNYNFVFILRYHLCKSEVEIRRTSFAYWEAICVKLQCFKLIFKLILKIALYSLNIFGIPLSKLKLI